MKNRLSTGERGEIAFKLRSEILISTNPEQWELIHDPIAEPDETCIGFIAFDYFLDTFRIYFRESTGIGENISYNIGWVKETLKRHEEKISHTKLSRIAAEMFMEITEEDGGIERACETIKKSDRFKGIERLPEEQVDAFLYEVLYELSREYAYELSMKFR